MHARMLTASRVSEVDWCGQSGVEKMIHMASASNRNLIYESKLNATGQALISHNVYKWMSEWVNELDAESQDREDESAACQLDTLVRC